MYELFVYLILFVSLSVLLFTHPTFQAALTPFVFISLFAKILICVFVDNYDDWKPSPVMTSSSEKPTTLLSTLQLLHICKWQEVMLRWRPPLRNWDSLSVFCLSSQTLPSYLISLLTCFISAAGSRSESLVRFNHSLLVALPAALGSQENVEVRRIPTRTEVHDYTRWRLILAGTCRGGSRGCLSTSPFANDAQFFVRACPWLLSRRTFNR